MFGSTRISLSFLKGWYPLLKKPVECTYVLFYSDLIGNVFWSVNQSRSFTDLLHISFLATIVDDKPANKVFPRQDRPINSKCCPTSLICWRQAARFRYLLMTLFFDHRLLLWVMHYVLDSLYILSLDLELGNATTANLAVSASNRRADETWASMFFWSYFGFLTTFNRDL